MAFMLRVPDQPADPVGKQAENPINRNVSWSSSTTRICLRSSGFWVIGLRFGKQLGARGWPNVEHQRVAVLTRRGERVERFRTPRNILARLTHVKIEVVAILPLMR
jgi:hypothetical protein